MYPTLTKKQKDILEYIKVYDQMHGYSPSLEEIKNQFRLSAISTVHEHIQNLKKKGFIYSEINQARSIKAVDPNIRERDFMEIPIVFTLSKNDITVVNKNQKTIAVPKDMLNRDGSYIAMVVDTPSYNSIGIMQQDILILKESAEVKTQALIVASTKSGKTFLLKAGAGGKIEINTKDTMLFKNLCIKAIVCSLMRKYQ